MAILRSQNAATHPLRFLESLKLRLTLEDLGCPPADLPGAIHAAFRALANLRFANLKEARVTIRIKSFKMENTFTNERLAELAASFQSTLLDPTFTKEDQTRYLRDQLYDLGMSLEEEEANYSSTMTEVTKLQKEADASREAADNIKQRIRNVQGALQNQGEVLPHRVLRRRSGTTGDHGL